MKTILAKKNFGFDGKHVDPGMVLTVDPDDFGGTYKDFLKAGLFEETSTTDVKPAADEGVPQTELPVQSRVKKPARASDAAPPAEA